VVSGTTEQLLAETYSVGTVTVGDFLDTAFRVRNPTDATLRAVMNVAGAGFNFSSLPAWPPDVPAGGSLDFVVRFQPQTAGLYSAYLNINGVRVSILLGEAAQGITLTVVGGGGIGDLSAGDTIQFGGVPVGESVRKQFELRNPTGRALAVNTLAVAGEAFRGPVGLQAPLTLEAQQRATFEVAFEPKAAGIAAGSLQFDQRSFPLEGIGIVPDYPKPQILIEPQTLSGGQQARVSVRLESASRYTGSGELSIDLRPAVGTGSDPAVLFLATNTPTVRFQVAEGLDAAAFGNQAAAEFQTGTTAGTLVLTARLGKHTVEQTAVIPPAAVVVDSTSVLRSASGLEVKLTGFDTSRTASRVAFTFFDRDWNVIAPGTIGVEVAPAFRQYFDTAGMGGMFLLRAVFPVTGNALKVVAVQTEFTNSHGRTLTPRVGIP
jgi:hypothetical protein